MDPIAEKLIRRLSWPGNKTAAARATANTKKVTKTLIKKLIKGDGITITHFCDLIGISTSTYYRWGRVPEQYKRKIYSLFYREIDKMVGPK